jgi:creatinine amidohydrolase
MRFGDLTFEEVSALAADGALAVVPTGCTEQQGPHLPVDNDTWFTETVLVDAAERVAPDVSAVVLPALPFGPTPEHRSFGAGFIDIPVPVFNAYVAAILESLSDQGFSKILVWRGCGGHDLRDVVNSFNSKRGDSTRVFLPAQPFHDVWCSVADPTVAGGHADSFTTSILQAKRPASVRADRLPQETSREPDWNDPNLDFARYSTTGVVGSAAHASPELGHRLWEASVHAVADVIRRIVRDPTSLRVEPTMLWAGPAAT